MIDREMKTREPSLLLSFLLFVRDCHLVPFYLIAQLNAPSWTYNDEFQHRRAMNQLNGALILFVLNFMIVMDLWIFLGKPFKIRINILLYIILLFSAWLFGWPFRGTRGQTLLLHWNKQTIGFKCSATLLAIGFYGLVTADLVSAPKG